MPVKKTKIVNDDWQDMKTPPALIERAIESGASVEVMERLLSLQQRWEEGQAKKAYASAIADLRPDLPEIIKNRSVDFTTERGRTHYRYEDLQSVTEALSPPMAKHGLSFRWRTVSDGPDKVTVSCIISHRAGHSEENSLSARHDTSGNKNPIQALGSAVTYLQRYTLKAAVGVAAATDDDGQSATPDLPDYPRPPRQTDPETMAGRAKPPPRKDEPKPLGQNQQKLKDEIDAHAVKFNLSDNDKCDILAMVTSYEPYTKGDKTVSGFAGIMNYDFAQISDKMAQVAIGKFREYCKIAQSKK
jgi:ERF superfamily